ncbi:MAG: imidazolonepropionase [candidate division Zixibacteria bacterium]|nr:imidazolonepropionase [candidate division Zixibacteria bacterium]
MLSDNPVTLIINNIGQLLTMDGPVPRVSASMRELGMIRNGALAIADDTIVWTGERSKLKLALAPDCIEVDAEGKVVTPGLIDPHTHPVFSATREDEFEMRLQGKSYMEIAQAGGGIRRSVRDLRSTPEAILYQKAMRRLDRFVEHGVTTIEAKSGYGLSTGSELKQLEVIRDLHRDHVIDLVPTFMGAHEFPDEYRDKREKYVELIINEMLPAVAQSGLAAFSDIFCEKGVFDLDQSYRIQDAARGYGMKLKFHADELVSFGGAELAASMSAVSADHLVYISDAGIKAMAGSRTVAVLLPGTSYSLGHGDFAPARKMIDNGVVVALSTDCNPGSNYSESLPMMISFAATQLRMTAAEAFCAVTVNAACAIDLGGQVGMLIPGLPADLVIWEMDDYRELPYHYGVNLVSAVIKRGQVVLQR